MKFRDHRVQDTAELELAPMMDVVFLLLIFFIATWQFARFEHDMDISVPAAETQDDKERQVGEIIINVRESGEIVINNSVVNKEQLLARLQLISSEYPDQAVILRGHSNTDFQSVINVLDQVKKAGIWNVAFATTKPE